MNKTSDIVIIGGGVIGCAAAYYLAQNGVTVTVLEKSEIGHGGSCRNGGGVRQSARDVRELPLAMYGVKHLWPYLSEELGMDLEYYCKGNLRLGMTEAHLGILRKLISSGVENGLDVRLIGGDEAKEICTCISDQVIGASWCPTDGHANPLRVTLAYYRRAKDLGVRFITGEDVTSIRKIGGKAKEIVTKNNVYSADQIILAAGYDSRAIAQTVGIDVPMEREFSEVLVTEDYPHMFDQMIGTAMSDFYGHQTQHGSFVFGGQCGLEPYYSNVPSAVTHSITAPYLSRGILKYFPVLEKIKVLRTWSGWIDVCTDHVPVISEVEEVPGLILACAFSGHGFGIAPIVGTLLCELALKQRMTLSLHEFRYDRFKAKD